MFHTSMVLQSVHKQSVCIVSVVSTIQAHLAGVPLDAIAVVQKTQWGLTILAFHKYMNIWNLQGAANIYYKQ